jgi:hypothetical protein
VADTFVSSGGTGHFLRRPLGCYQSVDDRLNQAGEPGTISSEIQKDKRMVSFSPSV